MSDLPTLYRTNEPYAEEIHNLIEIGMLVPVTEPLLTREEAANDPEVQRLIRVEEYDVERMESYYDGYGVAEVTEFCLDDDCPGCGKKKPPCAPPPSWHICDTACSRTSEVTDDE